jgi:Flp pilus assembly protein TadG
VVNRRFKFGIRTRQAGAAAIEFALLFTLFFAIFYALVSYSVTMLLQQAFTHAAAEGARAAIAVNPLDYPDTASFNTAVEGRVQTTIDNALTWLPQKAKTAVTGDNIDIGWAGNTMTVRVVYRGYAADPMLPVLNLPAVGDVPKLPTDLAGSASITL